MSDGRVSTADSFLSQEPHRNPSSTVRGSDIERLGTAYLILPRNIVEHECKETLAYLFSTLCVPRSQECGEPRPGARGKCFDHMSQSFLRGTNIKVNDRR